MPKTTVHVVVRGVKGREGRMRLALFAAPDGFPGEVERAVRRMHAPIDADSVVFVIDDVTAGAYAVSILHDENDDEAMATGAFGRPAEGYGFSRNARGTFGPPGFDDAAFVVAGEPVDIVIDLIYH